ncbi:UDP-N-acetyl-D-glucosamine dehydrogenase, partial [bacterium]|nr:UDP-N-acetyl-D-glucosamine dehydrogenase [bacterium]
LYLSWKLKSLDYRARFIELAAEINSEMPRFVVNKIVSALNSARKPVNGSKILLVGVSYKKDVSDTRESPALDILTILEKDGAKVYYHDPLVAELDFNGKKYKSRSLTKRFLGQLDCAVIVTDHSQIDYSFILNEAAVIIDTRNVYKDFKSNKVVTL